MIKKWKGMSSKKQRSIVLGGLVTIILLMAIGYAAFSTQLRIDGTSNITSNFAVLITGIDTQEIVGGASNTSEPRYTDTTATFNTDLKSPGDSITYKITVYNQGTLDATLSSIDIQKGSNDAIVFETSGIKQGDNLLKTQTDELFIKVTYSNSVTSQPDVTNSEITVTLNYEQATGGNLPVEPDESISVGGTEIAVVSSGDGLYTDTYETGRYVYKGANPNNYITFSGETWRIISVEVDGTIKIMRNESIGDIAWDSNNSNDWSGSSTLNTYLQYDYLSSLSQQDKVVSHNWFIGAVEEGYNNLATEIADEKEVTWNGKVGLITASEYLRANSNIAYCGTHDLNYENPNICKTTNWIYNIVPSEGYLWLISPDATFPPFVFYVDDYNRPGDLNIDTPNGEAGVAPALYLSADITLTGEGTEDSPYVIG